MLVDHASDYFEFDSDNALLRSAKLLCDQYRQDFALAVFTGSPFAIDIEGQSIFDKTDGEYAFQIKSVIEKDDRKVVLCDYFILIETTQKQAVIIYKFIPESLFDELEKYFFFKAISAGPASA